MNNGDWLERLPVIGRFPPDEAVVKLWATGKHELADALAASQQDTSIAYGSLSRHRIGLEKTSLHTAHTIGYLAPLQGRLPGALPIGRATDIMPDETLMHNEFRFAFNVGLAAEEFSYCADRVMLHKIADLDRICQARSVVIAAIPC